MRRFFVLIVSFAVSATCGCSNSDSPAESSTPPATQIQNPHALDSIAAKIENLEAHLLHEPDDGDSWSLLAQYYGYEGRLADARRAIERAVALGADESELRHRVDLAHDGGDIE